MSARAVCFVCAVCGFVFLGPRFAFLCRLGAGSGFGFGSAAAADSDLRAGWSMEVWAFSGRM